MTEYRVAAYPTDVDRSVVHQALADLGIDPNYTESVHIDLDTITVHGRAKTTDGDWSPVKTESTITIVWDA